VWHRQFATGCYVEHFRHNLADRVKETAGSSLEAHSAAELVCTSFSSWFRTYKSELANIARRVTAENCPVPAEEI
jgi:hypothetical protein